MHLPIPSPTRRAGAALLVAVAACSSDGTSPPPAAQSVQVTVATAGFHLDPDGYRVLLGSREGVVGVNGSVTFDQLEPGSYSVELTGLQENCTADGGPSVGLVLAEGETKSVTFDITCAYDMSGAVLPVVACPGLVPAADHGLPGEEIALGALPAALTAPLFARVSWAGGDEAGLAFVDPDATTMVAPLHPAALMAGGAVEIRISDEAGSCAPFTFTVDALTPAPGEFATVVELWQDLLDAQAAMAGVTVSDLKTRPMEDFPLPVWGLHVAQGLLDHPATANSLRALAGGTAPDLQEVDLEYLEALIASMGMRGALERRIAAASEGVALLNPPAGAPAAVEIRSAIDCLSGIEDEVALETCMTLARRNILGPIEEAYVNDLKNSLTFIQTLPITHQGFKQLFQALSGLVLLETHFADYLAGVLPTEFVSMEVQPNPVFFYEDTPGPGRWTPAEVRAVSKGWESDKLLQEIMLRALKASDSYGNFVKESGKAAAARIGLEATETAWNTFLANVINQVYSAILKGVFGLSVEGPDVPPETFGPIPLRSEAYVTSRMVLDEFVVRAGHDALDPRKPGTDYLHVITAAGRFGGVNIQTDPVIPIEVRQLEMQFWELSQATQEIYVTANESLDLTLAVRSSQFPEMVKLETLRPEWGTAELTIGNGDTQGGWTVHSVVYTAPDDLTKLPGLLTATHTATTGARQHGGQVRKADVRILPVAVEITTEPTCLEPGDSLFIEVDLKGTNAAELVWSADAGTIRQDGLFIASDELPQVKVTVEVRDKAAASDFIYLQVGACTCQGVLTLNGTIPETERVYFTLTPDLTAVREVGWQGPLSTAGFTFGSTPGVEETVALGGTGTFPAVGGGIVDGVGLFANFGDGEDPPMTPLSADISENEGGNVLAGAVGGWVRLGDLENPVPFTLTFRVVADPAFSTATDRICYVNP